MSYKDKEKQREANRERQRRYKESQKALLKGVTSEGVTEKALLKTSKVWNHHSEANAQEVIIGKLTVYPRVTPGIPIEGMTVKSEVVIAEKDSSRAMDVVIPPKTKKTFADLPKDVQENILRVSNMRIGNVEPDPVLVSEEIGRRTQVALHYQKFVRAG